MMPQSMSKDEAHEYLDARPGWIVLSTVGRDGFPHSVPVGYFRIGDDVYVGGRTSAQRVRNVARNPRVSLLLESGQGMADIKGLMIQGEADLVTARDEALRLAREAARQRGAPNEQLPDEVGADIAYIRVRPQRYVSWDYSRDG